MQVALDDEIASGRILYARGNIFAIIIWIKQQRERDGSDNEQRDKRANGIEEVFDESAHNLE